MNRKKASGDVRALDSIDELPATHDLPTGAEIALVGDLSEHEVEIADRLLSIPPGGCCTIYFNSPGGSAYTAMSIASLITFRRLEATAVVTGECSSAAIWPFAACRHRYVAPHSVFLFHPLKWQSEEHVELREAAEWARHFGELEDSMDRCLAEYLDVPGSRLRQWMRPGKYLSGLELVAAGVAELIELVPRGHWSSEERPQRRSPRRRPKAVASS